MWLWASFSPVGLFSLRPFNATSSGGKSLLVPTPFAVKMALLDVLWREQGPEAAQQFWPALRDLGVAIQLPEVLVVNHTFVKIMRPKEIKVKKEERAEAIARAIQNGQWPMGNTIAFREYVHFGGPLGLALRGEHLDVMAALLARVNYLGKRGGFVQVRALPALVDDLGALGDPRPWTVLTEESTFALHGTLQPLDDCGPKMTLDHADIFSGKGLRLHADNGRIIRHITLPTCVKSSSRSFTHYQHLEIA